VRIDIGARHKEYLCLIKSVWKYIRPKSTPKLAVYSVCHSTKGILCDMGDENLDVLFVGVFDVSSFPVPEINICRLNCCQRDLLHALMDAHPSLPNTWLIGWWDFGDQNIFT
jgi:hypothetical protein